MVTRVLRPAVLAISASLVMVAVALPSTSATATGQDPCDGEPATSYTLTNATVGVGDVHEGEVTFESAGITRVADFTIATHDILGHPDVQINGVSGADPGIEYRPQTRPTAPADVINYWTNRIADTVVLTFDVDAEEGRVRLRQALDSRTGGNSEASTYTLSWDGGGVAVVSDPVVVDAVYNNGSTPGFAADNGEIEDLETGDELVSGDSFVVYATLNNRTEWRIDFPIGARNIRISKVALMGATHDYEPRGASDNPLDGRDVQLPRFGIENVAQGPAAPGLTFQEFLAFQVLFVPEECIPEVVEVVPEEEDDDVQVVVDDVEEETAAVEEETAAPSAPSLSCTPQELSVGEIVTCQVTGGEPNSGIVWSAAAGDDEIASETVQTGSDGTGTFSFVVPAAALGQALTVDLVASTQPVALGVVGGPAPASVPAGEGSVPTPLALLLAAIVSVGGAVLMGRRELAIG